MATTAVTSGNIITITDDLAIDGVNQSQKVIVRAKKNVYSNITGTKTAPVFSLIDHQGNTVFTATFDNTGAQTGSNSINSQTTLSIIITAFNTWNGGAGVKNLQHERVYIAQLTQTSTSAPTYTVIKNTLQNSIDWTYTGVGIYTQVIGTKFDKTKAAYAISGGIAATSGLNIGVNSDTLTITTATSNSAANALLTASPVIIRVQH
jgi:hypothetical protein